MGDLNAKVGNDNTGYEEVMGSHGLGTMNDNGERFANLCAANNFVIGGTTFQHKKIHKVTWISPDHVTKTDRPYMYWKEVQKITPRRESNEGS